MSRRTTIVVAVVAGLVLWLAIGLPYVEPVFHLVFGWYGYLNRVLPAAQPHAPGIGMALLCVAGILVFGHRFAAWLARSLNLRPWRFKWTLLASALLFLLFSAGMAATGIGHQAGWMLSTPNR